MKVICIDDTPVAGSKHKLVKGHIYEGEILRYYAGEDR